MPLRELSDVTADASRTGPRSRQTSQKVKMFLEFLTTWFQKNPMPARPPHRRRKSEFTRADLG
jgi:hypothetical protein